MANRTPTAVEARYHRHDNEGVEIGHLHRRGNEQHDHDTDGRPVFPEDRPRDPVTGKFVAKQEPADAEADTIVLPAPTDPRLEVEALSDLAVATIDDRAFLVDLAVRTFEFEAAACEDAAGRLAAEVEGRDRFLVLAAAAKTAGHHPFTAYCFVADRLDPVVTA